MLDVHKSRLSVLCWSTAEAENQVQGTSGISKPPAAKGTRLNTIRITRKGGPESDEKGNNKSAMPLRSSADEFHVAQPAKFDAHSEPHLSAETSGLQPSELLNHEAMRGKFSMQRILDTHIEKVDNVTPERPISQPTQDAIEIGLVSQSIAEHLFRRYIFSPAPFSVVIRFCLLISVEASWICSIHT